MQAQLTQLEKDYGIVWQEYRIGDLFDIEATKKKFNASDVEFGGKFRYVARGERNNGIKGYISEDSAFLNSANTISFGQDTATMFYQKESYFTGDKIKIFKPKSHLVFNEGVAHIFISAMKKAFASFSWGSNSYRVSILNAINIQLPTTTVNGQSKIAFDFMEAFIATLKAERIATLKAYLKTTGLSDYTITDLEQSTLDSIDKVQWDVFKIEDILDWQQNIAELNPLHLNSLSVDDERKYPFYGQATANNGIIEYRHLIDDTLNNKLGKPTILIHSNNQNTVYLETPFYLKDGHGATSVLQSDSLNKLTAQFMIGAIKKVILQKYTYNAKATKIELKNTEIVLPIKPNKTPDYEFMEVFISAMQKVVIRNLLDYADQEIDAHQQVTKAG